MANANLTSGHTNPSAASWSSSAELAFIAITVLPTCCICCGAKSRNTHALAGPRYLIGCSSLTSQDPAEGAAVYQSLLNWQVRDELRTTPQPEFGLPPSAPSFATAAVPKLLRTYLAIGARICGPPAIDRDFKTIDFLTLLDLHQLHPRIRARFLDPP